MAAVLPVVGAEASVLVAVSEVVEVAAVEAPLSVVLEVEGGGELEEQAARDKATTLRSKKG